MTTIESSQGEAKTSPPAKEDDINLGDLRNTMDRLMEEDNVLDNNTNNIGIKTSKEKNECSNSSTSVQLEAYKEVT
ncbi:hypothetical protein Tco_0015329 [Tanacetum coccineum]